MQAARLCRESLQDACMSVPLVLIRSASFNTPVQAWTTARSESSFAKSAPVLEEWVSLVREASALIDPSRPAYDVALEEFEKGMTSARIDKIFTQVSDKGSASGMVQ